MTLFFIQAHARVLDLRYHAARMTQKRWWRSIDWHTPLDGKAGRLVGRRRTVHCDTVCGLDDRTQASAADTPH